MSPLSTVQVARKIGVSKATLERWLAEGNVPRPKPLRIGEKVFRNWSDADIAKVVRYKQQNYRKGRGRKPKPKQ